MYFLKLPNSVVALVCVIGALCVLSSSQRHQVSTSPVQQHSTGSGGSEPLIGDNGNMWLTGNDCAADEVLTVGVLPSCEPTCANPKPVCVKMFIYDFAPCFCKAPLVRNKATGKCVPLDQCPEDQRRHQHGGKP